MRLRLLKLKMVNQMQSTESPSEEVIDDDTPGNALHTEADEKLQFHLRMTQQMNVLKLDKTSWIV